MAWTAAMTQTAATAGSGILGSILAYQSSRKNTKDTIRANKQMAEYGYSKDLEMWRLQNEYNSPQAQMMRLRDAGLNPNLVYGQGAGSAGSASQMPRYNTPTLQYNRQPFDVSWIPQVLGQYQDFQLKQAQINQVKATTDNINTKTLNEQVSNFLLKNKVTSTSQDIAQKDITYPYQATILENRAKGSRAQMEQEFTRLMIMSHEQQSAYLENMIRERRLTQMDVETDLKRANMLFQAYKNDWMRAGITTSDSPVLRILVRMANALGFDLSGIGNMIK